MGLPEVWSVEMQLVKPGRSAYEASTPTSWGNFGVTVRLPAQAQIRRGLSSQVTGNAVGSYRELKQHSLYSLPEAYIYTWTLWSMSQSALGSVCTRWPVFLTLRHSGELDNRSITILYSWTFWIALRWPRMIHFPYTLSHATSKQISRVRSRTLSNQIFKIRQSNKPASTLWRQPDKA